MVFVSRRIVYPFFTVLILIVFFAILYMAFFSQPLVADINNSSVSIVDAMIVIKVPLENKSSHVIDHVSVNISSDKGSKTFWLKGDENSSQMLPGEKFDFNTSTPLGESFSYTLTVMAPFNRPIYINIPLDPTTVDPVKAELSLDKNMVAGKTYYYTVKLCNQSASDLAEVFWVENASPGDFKENFYERVVSLNKAECKTIYSSLTPIRSGAINLGFSLRIGALKKEVSAVLDVTGTES